MGQTTPQQRPNLHLYEDDTGYIDIDPERGAPHEPNTSPLSLGPPKTDDSVRRVTLAPFLVRLLRAHLLTHNELRVFVTPQGDLRRSNFSRRATHPSADGIPEIAQALRPPRTDSDAPSPGPDMGPGNQPYVPSGPISAARRTVCWTGKNFDLAYDYIENDCAGRPNRVAQLEHFW